MNTHKIILKIQYKINKFFESEASNLKLFNVRAFFIQPLIQRDLYVQELEKIK
ncbi:hypothetical protein pb186bvf_001954 [Paramecium bursaria]